MPYFRIYAIFVSHCRKFTVAQGTFYDEKFSAENSKIQRKSENWRKSPMLNNLKQPFLLSPLKICEENEV
jgi:hypothetical protein